MTREVFGAYPVSSDVVYSNGTFDPVQVHIVQHEENVDYVAILQRMGPYGGEPQAGLGEIQYQHLAFLAGLFIFEVSPELCPLAVEPPELDPGDKGAPARASYSQVTLGRSERRAIDRLALRAVWACDRHPVLLVWIAALDWAMFFVHEVGIILKKNFRRVPDTIHL
jgi:hypothetical protein